MWAELLQGQIKVQTVCKPNLPGTFAVLLKWDKNSPFFAQKEDSVRRRVGGYQASYLSPNNQLLSIRMVTSSLALSHPNDHHVGMDM